MQKIMLAMPFDLVKSGTDGEMRIGGYASTADRDRQGESVMQKCLDISEFVTTGFFNLDHDGSKILGYPDGDRCRVDGRGLYVEGTLLKGVPEAESMYRTAVALRKSNAPRRLGFSVEGQVLERNGDGLITKAKVYNVALTAQPVNPNCTWDALCKSFVHNIPETTDTYAESKDTLAKALDTAETGAPLIPESLEEAFRKLADIIGQDEDASVHLDALREILRGRQKLTRGEAALYLAMTRGESLDKCMSLVAAIFE